TEPSSSSLKNEMEKINVDSTSESSVKTAKTNQSKKLAVYPRTGTISQPLITGFGFMLIGIALLIKYKK
ncbi:LPXTG cell wall anchor domain-containing protein, partial [Enterococcus sp.]|uniref:LPXTG cell wall anchor domain-containing protein n=1 Tax=Enterococcus sp. TaxID=35783 RepID=UPI003C716E41